MQFVDRSFLSFLQAAVVAKPRNDAADDGKQPDDPAAVSAGSHARTDDAKPAEWLFVHTAQTAEMTSPTTLVMPVTRDIFAFTDRPNRLHDYVNAHEFVS